MLNRLEGFVWKHMGLDSADQLHVVIEAMKRAYADRARHLGDPALADMPMQRLLSKDYAERLRSGHRHAPRDSRIGGIADLSPPRREGQNTTHFSVVDRFGNAVSNTYTLELSYGLGMVARGTGVLLNNELDDFTAAVGASNALVSSARGQSPGPGKRPLSSMSPTIVLKDGRPVLVTGTPGGSRIITGVLQIILNRSIMA